MPDQAANQRSAPHKDNDKANDEANAVIRLMARVVKH
jgi:hypothetical protein